MKLQISEDTFKDLIMRWWTYEDEVMDLRMNLETWGWNDGPKDKLMDLWKHVIICNVNLDCHPYPILNPQPLLCTHFLFATRFLVLKMSRGFCHHLLFKLADNHKALLLNVQWSCSANVVTLFKPQFSLLFWIKCLLPKISWPVKVSPHPPKSGSWINAHF